MDVWGGSWGGTWDGHWAQSMLPPVETLILGAIRIRPLLGAAVQMKTVLSGDIETGPLIAGKIRIDDP